MFFVGPYRTVGTICNDRRFFSYPAGGLGDAKSPPAGQGRGLVGVQELRKSGILRYKIQPKNSTFWFSFLVQNEFKRKDHPLDVLNKANYRFPQISPS